MSSRAGRVAAVVVVVGILLARSPLARAGILVLGSSASVSGQLVDLNRGGHSISAAGSASGTDSASFSASTDVGGTAFSASGSNAWIDGEDVLSTFDLSYPTARSVQVQAVYSYAMQTDQASTLILNPLSINLIDAGATLVVHWPDGTSNSYPGDLSKTGPTFRVDLGAGSFTVEVYLNNNVGNPAQARTSHSQFELSIVPAPEPPGLMLFGLGTLGLLGGHWVRRSRSFFLTSSGDTRLGVA
jgi:hypothetical protein